MRLHLVCCVLVLVLMTVLAENAEETANKDQEEEEEYEDIAVAESQDIVHSHTNLSSDEDHVIDRPRSRPRGRKRRRRLRKRPRSTTPSFIEEYDPERSVKEPESSLQAEDEVIYQRRRPSKRRRRPMTWHSEYDINTPDTEITPEPLDERPYQEHHRPRNPQRRRRRKGGRKRIRTTTEPPVDLNNTQEVGEQEVTTHPPEVVMQLNNYSSHEQENPEISPLNHQLETTTSTLPTAFTTKEITEINHKLESLSKYQQSSDQDYHISGLGAFSFFHPTSSDSTTQHFDNHEDNHIISSSTTPKDYSWITRFEPKATSTTSEAFQNQESKLHNVESGRISKQESRQNIKNIEKIIENRKNLFSKSRRRLPLTSALIRRRLHPKKHLISTTQETIVDNTIPTSLSHLEIERKPCHLVECALNKTSILSNNIVPNVLLPSGFPTMPEILSTAELIKKISQIPKLEEQNSTVQSTLNNNEISNNESSNLIIITPSTLIRYQSQEENRQLISKDEGKNSMLSPINKGETKNVVVSETSTKNPEEFHTSTSTEPTTLNVVSVTDKLTHDSEVISTLSSTTVITEDNPTTTRRELTSESDKFKLDDVDTSNINDEILELIMDEMGKARVKRILELRNMSLSELIAHRERGAGHFSMFSDENNPKNGTKEGAGVKSIHMSRKISMEEPDTEDEEQTEKMIVEKAKYIISEFKKNDEVKSINKTSQEKILDFGEKLKVEGTVIPVSILESTHSSAIQFPDDTVLGAFPKYMHDIAGTSKRTKPNQQFLNQKSVFTEPLNKPRDIQQFNGQREPRVFESMPKFSSETSNKANLEISPYPDWRITVTKTSTTEKSRGFPGTSKEIMFVASTTTKSTDLDDVFLLDEGEEVHHVRNHILGRNINIESQDMTDEDYSEEKKVPAGVKSAIAASGALLAMAICGFLAVLVSCKIRQRRARLRVRRDILNEHLAEDFRSSQRSLTPVLRKTQFSTGIHSNTASNRHYYLWRTLRKTFQYE